MTKQIEKVQNKNTSMSTFLLSQRKQIEAALPRSMSPDRLLRVAMTELRKNPKLMECTHISVIASIIQCAQLGIEPGNNLGHAYLIPWKNSRTGQYECQFMLGYRGMIELALRADKVKAIFSSVVYEGDVFDLELGTNQKLSHRPTNPSNRGRVIGAYSIAKLGNGENQIEFLFKEDIDKIRDQSSKGHKNPDSPWQTSYDEMCKKTVTRRLFKYLPISIEVQQAVGFDDKVEKESQDYGLIIDYGNDNNPIIENQPEMIIDQGSDERSYKTKSDEIAERI